MKRIVSDKQFKSYNSDKHRKLNKTICDNNSRISQLNSLINDDGVSRYLPSSAWCSITLSSTLCPRSPSRPPCVISPSPVHFAPDHPQCGPVLDDCFTAELDATVWTDAFQCCVIIQDLVQVNLNQLPFAALLVG